MQLPGTLHAQLYLLTFDVERRRFRNDRGADARSRFDYALEAAMLTDLHLAGYIEDRDGKAYQRGSGRPDDPLLDEALRDVTGKTWAKVIRYHVRHPQQKVRRQLEEAGWLEVRRRNLFGIVPARFGVVEEGMVSALADRVRAVLHSVIDGHSADPRLVALGLIAAQADMHVVSGFVDDRQQREALHRLTSMAIEPIGGLHEAILNRLAERRARIGASGH